MGKQGQSRTRRWNKELGRRGKFSKGKNKRKRRRKKRK